MKSGKEEEKPMNEEIAVVLGGHGKTATLHDSAEIVIYKKTGRQWSLLKAMPFCIGEVFNLHQLRLKMKELIAFLGECKVLAALSVSGAPYFELEKHGYAIWEIKGKPPAFLQMILDEETESACREDGLDEKPGPAAEEVYPGHLRISLHGMQGCGNGLSSKQILQPILKKGEFLTLEILCDHAPPWLVAKILSGELRGVVEKIAGNESTILIAYSK